MQAFAQEACNQRRTEQQLVGGPLRCQLGGLLAEGLSCSVEGGQAPLQAAAVAVHVLRATPQLLQRACNI